MLGRLINNDVARVIGGAAVAASLVGLGFAAGLAWPRSSDAASEGLEQLTTHTGGSFTNSTPTTVTIPSTTEFVTSSPASTEVPTTPVVPSTQTTLDTADPPAAPETSRPTEIDLAEVDISAENVDRYTFFSGGKIALNEFDEGTLWCFSEQHNVHYIEFRLDREFSTFSAFIGYSDSSSSGTENTIEIKDENGLLLYGGRMSLGLGEWVELDVSNVIRLRFICNSRGNSGSTIGIGNPVLRY